MKTLTNTQVLRAAEKRLAEHRAMRPATAAELQAEAARLSRMADSIVAQAKAEPRPPAISDVIGCQRLCLGGGFEASSRELSLREHQRVGGVIVAKAAAAKLQLKASALEAAARLGDGGQYRDTERELQARVDYYGTLVKKERAADIESTVTL